MKAIRYTPPSVACALHYLFSTVDEEDAEEFCDVVLSGLQVGSSYSSVGQAASMLREWLVRAATGSKKTPPWVVANIWIKAWNAGQDGTMPKVLTWKDGIDNPVIIK